MSRKKTERQASLVMCLLNARRHLTVQEIRDTVPGYESDGEEAFRRMFERDKDELREAGIPLETGGEFGDGYRIARRDYELPEITLEADEAAVVALAARLWEAAPLAGATGSALLKLRAAGVDALAGPSDLEARIEAAEPAFEDCWRATREGRSVRFGYRTAGNAQQQEREVDTWGMVCRSGRWYLVGWDRGRGAERVFRLSRVTGSVTVFGAPNSVVRPDLLDLPAAVARLAEGAPVATATLRVRAGTAAGLRQRARLVSRQDGWDQLAVDYADASRLAAQIAQYTGDVVALAPQELRAAVIAHLTSVLEVSA